jgi:hypothetical protein
MLKLTFLRTYRRSHARQTVIDRGLKDRAEVRLLTALVCYLIKGLVQRPDDMSSSRDMVKRLQVTVRAEVHGFPSLQPALLSDCLTRIDGEPDADEYRILRYSHRFKPSGARLKSTRAQGAPRSNGLESEDESHGSAATAHNTAPGSMSRTAPAGPGLTVEDEEWVRVLVNSALARWLWFMFPDKDKKHSLPVGLLEGPFRFRTWGIVVRDGVKHKANTKTGAFSNAADKLFPSDWRFSAHDGVQWRGYQSRILDPVIARIEMQTDHSRRQYSEAMRRSIIRHLNFWEYLPAGWSNKVWSYTGVAAEPLFGICANPSVSK